MNVVIMGCGRVGARVAILLDHGGHRVSVIDVDSKAFKRLPQDFRGSTVIGTGIDEDILRLGAGLAGKCRRGEQAQNQERDNRSSEELDRGHGCSLRGQEKVGGKWHVGRSPGADERRQSRKGSAGDHDQPYFL